MPQFAVHRNPNAATKGLYPLLLDVQSDIMPDLGTRVVVPLRPAGSKARLIDTLMPVVSVDGKPYALITPQLAGIPRAQLGVKVADLPQYREAIIAALDLLVTGI